MWGRQRFEINWINQATLKFKKITKKAVKDQKRQKRRIERPNWRKWLER